jgi:endoglucanase
MLYMGAYLMKCHYQTSDVWTDNRLVAQVGDPARENSYWGRPETTTVLDRPVITISPVNPGTDVAAQVSAAMAALSQALHSSHPDMSEDLMARAIQLYYFARGMNQRWKLPPTAKSLYPSYSHRDDLTWAAAWLCRGNSTFCAEALNNYDIAHKEGAYEVEMNYNSLLPQATMLLMNLGVAGAKRVEAFNDVLTVVLSHWMVGGCCAGWSAPAGKRTCFAPVLGLPISMQAISCTALSQWQVDRAAPRLPHSLMLQHRC